jgi:hypothetical protein
MCQLLPCSLPRSLVERHLAYGEVRLLLAGAPLAEGYAPYLYDRLAKAGAISPASHLAQPSFFVASCFRKSPTTTTTVRVLGAGNAGAAKSTTPNDAAETVS